MIRYSIQVNSLINVELCKPLFKLNRNSIEMKLGTILRKIYKYIQNNFSNMDDKT